MIFIIDIISTRNLSKDLAGPNQVDLISLLNPDKISSLGPY